MPTGRMVSNVWARKAPLPSRRLLRGAHGQRCNLSFDVGLDPHIPVMDAQFAGLMAVLLSHPEALRTCASMGIPWAETHLQNRKSNLAGTLDRKLFTALPILQRMDLPIVRFPLLRQVQFSPEIRQVQFSPEIARKLLNVDSSVFSHLRNVEKARKSINLLTEMKRQEAEAEAAQMSTTQKAVSAAAALAFGGALGYIGHRIYKAGK